MDGLDRRRLLGLFAGVGAAGLTGGLAGCTTTGDTTSKSAVRIGLLVPSSGGNKAVGIELENGFQLYLSLHAGAFNGHPIEVIRADEGDSVEAGTAALTELFGKSVVAVTGVANPDLLPAVRDLVEKTKVPLLASHAAPSTMTSAVYIWRTSFLTDEPGRAVGSYLKRRLMGNVGLIGLQGSSGTEMLGGFKKEYGKGAAEPVWVPAKGKPTAQYLSSYVNALRSSSPQAIFCHFPTAFMTPLMTALKAAGIDKDVYASGLVSEGGALNQLGSGGQNLYTAMHYSANLVNAANRTFYSAYQSKYQGTPTAYAVAAYDAAAVLDRAIALCGADSITALRVNQELSNVGQVISPRGNWQFNLNRAPQQKWYLRQVHMDGPILSNVLISDLATLG
jgi:branched-chain amino acid transport system substrate-binding protein